MKTMFDGYWIWLFSEEKPEYGITGKYLFFDSNKDKLIGIAINEIDKHGFHEAKVNNRLLEGQTDLATFAPLCSIFEVYEFN